MVLPISNVQPAKLKVAPAYSNFWSKEQKRGSDNVFAANIEYFVETVSENPKKYKIKLHISSIVHKNLKVRKSGPFGH